PKNSEVPKMSLFDNILAQQRFDEEGDFIPLLSLEEELDNNTNDSLPDVLPVLAVKNTVLFPGVVIPITVGRDKSIKAINKAYQNDRLVAVLSQKDSKIEEPGVYDLYKIGTVARIVRLLKMPDGSTTAILQGRRRFALSDMVSDVPFMTARVRPLEDIQPENPLEFEAMMSSVMDKARHIIELSPSIPSEAIVLLKNIDNRSNLLYFIASNLGIKVAAKQDILEISNLNERGKMVLRHMDAELQLLELKDQIESKVRTDI